MISIILNLDPTRPEERGVTNVKDERRSKGALCAASSTDIETVIPQILLGEIDFRKRTRIQCLVRSTYTETRLPPALNDILIAHPSPAAVSRFRLNLIKGHVVPSYDRSQIFNEVNAMFFYTYLENLTL